MNAPLVSILGPIRIGRFPDEVHLGPSLQRLLAVLVANRGSAVSVGLLADAVWGDAPPDGAEANLRSYVTRLRHALGVDSEVLRRSGAGYRLELATSSVDADLFERELDDAILALRTADPASAERSIERALGRWAGRAYGDFGDEEWARPEQVRLEERRVEAIELHVEVMLAHGRTEPAIALARSIAEEYPLRERPRELLMRALYIGGRQVDAVRSYRDYRKLLADETGLDPSTELVELEGLMLAGELPREVPAGRARGYQLGEVLGRGAFSVVHRATQPGVGRAVAVKIIRAEVADRPSFVQRFEREAQLAAAVEHPHVVPLYDFWREPGAAYLVMRWMRGGNLAQVLRKRGPVSRDELSRILEEVGGALHAAHRIGVLHRDVRPANLLRDEDGATYLADFGIAVGSTSDFDVRPIHYAAPEVQRGEAFAVAADVHSLGVTAFELLTGRLPLSDSADRTELVRRQLSEPVPSVRATRSDLPAPVDDALARATSKVADDRYSSVPEFVDDMLAAPGSADAHVAANRSDSPAPNPYVGLNAFTEVDAGRFHGREKLVGELADALERDPLIVVVGPSGSGKSSVVRAGLIPALRRGAMPGSESWFVTTMVPGPDPIAALETALVRVAVNPPASLRDQLPEDGGLLRSVRRVLPDDESTVLVVIDQFEELFTLVDSDELRARFLAELADAIQAPGSPLRVVATLRADHYDAPLRDPALAQLVTDGTVTVRPMRTDELEAAIVEPARQVGVEVDRAVVAELISGVSNRPAALPLLQFALTELYERRVAGVMLLETYQALGGLSGALAARADRIIERGDARDEELTRRIFSRLIAFSDNADGEARRRAPIAEFGDDERTAWLIDEFVSARLLVVDRDEMTREPTVEVAHEALLRDWPRLTSWIDEDRTDLRVRRIITTAASEWVDADGDEGMVARGGRLDLVTDLRDRRDDLLNETERAWIDESVRIAETAAQRDRRGRRRSRTALATTAVLLVVAVAAAAGALVLRGRASQSERAAEARELVLEAEKAIDSDPELAVLLGLEATAAFEESTGEVPTAALQVLRSGIRSNHVRARFPGGGWVAVLGDGDALATSNGDGGAVELRP